MEIWFTQNKIWLKLPTEAVQIIQKWKEVVSLIVQNLTHLTLSF